MNAFGAQLQNKALLFFLSWLAGPLQSWLLMGQEGHVRAAVCVLLDKQKF